MEPENLEENTGQILPAGSSSGLLRALSVEQRASVKAKRKKRSERGKRGEFKGADGLEDQDSERGRSRRGGEGGGGRGEGRRIRDR